MNKTLQIINQLKQHGQDFEFYPTTREIIEAMYWDIVGEKVGEETYHANGRRCSILDIGAGNCKLFNTINEIAEEQPLLDRYYYFNDSEKKSFRNDNERLANRVIITKYMVIEKSRLLVDMMPKDTLVVGMDFHENTLIDKQSDIVFCNPPYSEYAEWSTKIIREANAKYIYLVIPQRWGKHKGIEQALKDRKAKIKIIGNFDFKNAEDRKARAYVSLVKVELNYCKYRKDRYSRNNSNINVDPFDLWFNDYFKIKADKVKDDYFTKKEQKQEFEEQIKKELVSRKDLVSVLVELYNKELEKLLTNHRKLGEIDAELFRELKVDIHAVREAFKIKIIGLKNLYWEQIFTNLHDITKRLTRATRDKLKKKLMSNASIDFTENNIRSVVIWVIKQANHYYDEQMLELYDRFTTDKGIKFYKSNQHFAKDDFRYNKRNKKLEKYALDYRIVLHHYIDDWDMREGRISNVQYENIRDVSVIGRNLGFSVDDKKFANLDKYNGDLKYGEKSNIFFTSPSRMLPKGTTTLQGKIEEVYIHTGKPNENGERVMEKDGVLYVYSTDNKTDWVQYKINGAYFSEENIALESDIFTTVKPYKNGNVHFQFNKKFIQKLNLEVGRLRGWIKSPQEAAREFDISLEEACQYWKTSFTLLPENIPALLPNFKLNVADKEKKLVDVENGISVSEVAQIKPINSPLYNAQEMNTFKNGTLFDC